MNYHVMVHQLMPFDSATLQIFTEEEDAIRFAETYVETRQKIRIGRKTWKLLDTDLPTHLIVVKY